MEKVNKLEETVRAQKMLYDQEISNMKQTYDKKIEKLQAGQSVLFNTESFGIV